MKFKVQINFNNGDNLEIISTDDAAIALETFNSTTGAGYEQANSVELVEIDGFENPIPPFSGENWMTKEIALEV